jgi:hypothetical protein
MLRALGAFLAMFWVLSLLVYLDELAYLFGGAALALFAVDLLLTNHSGGLPVSGTRIRSVL